MPVVDVGDRLAKPHARLGLAREVIGIMFHPKSHSARRRRQSALAMIMLGMSDQDDEPEALRQVRMWFKQAGKFKTASQADPYTKQQQAALRRVPGIFAVGTLLHFIWAINAHHQDHLAGGASLNKAVALYAEFPYLAPMSSRMLWKLWSQYKGVAHLCAAFMCKFRSFRQAISVQTGRRFRWKPTARFGPNRHPVADGFWSRLWRTAAA